MIIWINKCQVNFKNRLEIKNEIIICKLHLVLNECINEVISKERL